MAPAGIAVVGAIILVVVAVVVVVVVELPVVDLPNNIIFLCKHVDANFLANSGFHHGGKRHGRGGLYRR